MKRRIARTQEGLNQEWAKYDKQRQLLIDEQKQFEKHQEEFNARVKDEEKSLRKRLKLCDEKERKILDQEKKLVAKEDSFQKTKQRVLRDSKKVEKLKKDLDAQKAEIDTQKSKTERLKKSLQRMKDDCQRAQKTFLLKVEPWQKKLVKLRKLKEDVRKETIDARLQYENEFEEKLAKWVNQWELKNEELVSREQTLQKDTQSLLEREEDLKEWQKNLEAFQEKLNQQQQYIAESRIDERESEVAMKLDGLAKEEEEFRARQEKLGEWEKTQIQKMKEYDEKNCKSPGTRGAN